MLDSLMLSPSQRASLEEMTATCEANVAELEGYLEPRGIGEEEAVQFRLGYASDGPYQGRMCIPYLTRAGVVAVKFRCTADHDCKAEGHPKYDGPAGQHARLYNVGAIARGGDIIAVCEGELDGLVCDSFVVQAVGTPGTHWQPHWGRCFADFDRVLVVADNDEKEDGSNPGLKHAKGLLKKVPHSELVIPPLGLDLNEWYLRDGADAIKEAMKL